MDMVIFSLKYHLIIFFFKGIKQNKGVNCIVHFLFCILFYLPILTTGTRGKNGEQWINRIRKCCMLDFNLLFSHEHLRPMH